MTKFKDRCHELKITFNDLILTILSISFKKYFVSKGFEKVDKLSIKNNLQSKFINLVTDFFIERKKELDELYKAKLITPVKETMDIAEKRLKLEFKTKIDDLKSSINSVETQIIFNNEFFEEIAEEWLGKVKTERGQILFNQLRDGDESVINELNKKPLD